MSERNVAETKNGRRTNEEDKQKLSTQNAFPCKYAGFGVAITAELMIGFWFGVGVILAVGVVDNLNYCVGALTSSGNK